MVLTEDEIEDFVDVRYVGQPEACWRLFEYPITERSHNVERLAVHLQNEQPVFYEEGGEEEAVQKAAT